MTSRLRTLTFGALRPVRNPTWNFARSRVSWTPSCFACVAARRRRLRRRLRLTKEKALTSAPEDAPPGVRSRRTSLTRSSRRARRPKSRAARARNSSAPSSARSSPSRSAPKTFRWTSPRFWRRSRARRRALHAFPRASRRSRRCPRWCANAGICSRKPRAGRRRSTRSAPATKFRRKTPSERTSEKETGTGAVQTTPPSSSPAGPPWRLSSRTCCPRRSAPTLRKIKKPTASGTEPTRSRSRASCPFCLRTRVRRTTRARPSAR